ncbi:hypothetical protein [Haloprofundus halobius]|uniref:hypothetical protein n=1 Tax=Haloprofundus halobius TaxID=2876194 RepID=UPI001CCA3D2A|nr:hypothetical protein [Haloprofundus halobius]
MGTRIGGSVQPPIPDKNGVLNREEIVSGALAPDEIVTEWDLLKCKDGRDEYWALVSSL